MNPSQIYNKCHKSIIKIISYNDNYGQQVGSGVVLKDKNIIITNFHNILNSSYFELYFNNKKIEHDGILAIDKYVDLLILKITNTSLFGLLKTSTKFQIGASVYAIGNPLDYDNSITSGIINGTKRTIETFDYTFGNSRTNLIQFSAQISPGNSGGALINDKGELIGITTLNDSSGQNLNFAIPMEEVFKLLNKSPKSTKKKNRVLEEETLRYHLNLVNGNYNQCIIHLNNCLDIQKENEYFIFNKLMLLINSNRPQEAIEFCDTLISKKSIQELLYIKYLALIKLMRFKQCLVTLKKAFSIKEDYYYLCELGSLYLILEEYQKAFSCFDKAIKINATEPVAYLGLAEYYAKLNQLFKAARLAFKIRDEFPQLSNTLYILGTIYFIAMKFERALEYFDRFIDECKANEQKIKLDVYEQDECVNFSLLNRVKSQRIKTLTCLNRPEEALEEVNIYLQEHSNESILYLDRAYVQLLLGNIASAQDDINKSIHLNPFDHSAFTLLATIDLQNDNYNSALSHINKALKLLPNSINILTYKAGILIKLKEYKEALKINNSILRIDKHSIQSMLILISLSDEQKNYKELLNYSKKILKTGSKNYFILSIYAYALLRNTKYKEALKNIEQSILLNETFPSLVIKALILFELGLYRDCINIFSYAENKSDLKHAWFESRLFLVKGKAEIGLKMNNSAKLSIEKAILLSPDVQNEALQLLETIS